MEVQMKNIKKTIICIMSICVMTFGAANANAENCKSGIVNGDVVNVRNGSSTANAILCKVHKGDKLSILNIQNDWSKVSISNGTIGWIYSSLLNISSDEEKQVTKEVTKDGVITGNYVNLRTGASLLSGIIKKLYVSNNVEILFKQGEWYNVKTSDEKVGWVYESYVSLNECSINRTDLINYAMQFLGCKYAYGGESPSGFDCSGYAQYVFSHFGITLNRVASMQATQGKLVSKKDLKPGDLVFFDTDGGDNNINHVATYIGDDKIIHASSAKGCVVISDLTYSNTYVTARSLIN
jgi:cell wall-associated NlpC family hydrolase